MKPALLVIDMLVDFVTGALKCERAQKILPNLRRLIEAARRTGVPVVYVSDAHSESDFEVVRVWGRHAMEGEPGARVVPELEPVKGDRVVGKRTYSGFFETGLDPLLRSLGVDTVVLTGIHTHVCVQHTAADALYRGYGIIVVRDGVEAFTEEDHERGLRYMEMMYKAELKSTEEVVGLFEGLGR